MLRNRYYLGVVTWRGVEYPGKHPALVTPEAFAAVQAVLATHRLSGERSFKHRQYLTGSVYCARCGSRLQFSLTTGRRGERYDYVTCAGRHYGRTTCDLPWLPLEQVEAAVIAQWQQETFPVALTAQLREHLTDELRSASSAAAQEQRRLSERVARIRRERYKWAEKAMEGTVPADIAREKQQALGEQLLAAESALARLSSAHDSHETTLHAVLDLVEHCGRAYALSDEAGRRDYNQAWFEAIYLDADDEDRRQRSPACGARRYWPACRRARASAREAITQEQERRRGGDPGGIDNVGVWNVAPLVELRGIEPLTYSGLQARVS